MHVSYPYFAGLLLLIPLFFYWISRCPRPLSPLRRRLITGLRLLVMALLAGGLIRLITTGAYERINVVFLLDLSRSISASTQQQALQFIRTVSNSRPPEDGVGLVVFGAEAILEHSVSADFTPLNISSEVDGTATNIARAVQLGLSVLPLEGKRRLVLASDGQENVSSVLEAATVARSLNAEIFTLPLGRLTDEPEVRAEKLIVPSQVKAGTPHRIEAEIHSTHDTKASLELLRGGNFLDRQEVALHPGKNLFSFVHTGGDEGVQLYQLTVNSQLDTIVDNNRLHAFTEFLGPPKILLLYDSPDTSSYLQEALSRQGLDLIARPWNELPHKLSGYLEYDALIFDNVPGSGISVSQMEILERYVRDMGGGLLMLGDEKSFGAGGYFRTPLEKILPVDMDIPSKMLVPSLCLVLVIDKSDSMGASVDNAQPEQHGLQRNTKLEIAKIAAYSAIKLLSSFDQVGLLAFNSDWEWTVPVTDAGRLDQITGSLSALTHGGGTDLYKGIREGIRVLREVKAMKKHLIALSDGLTPGMDFASLIGEATAHNITISTVALGKDADRTLMESIARWGRGRSYYTDNPLYIPRIFTSETILVSRNLIEEESFQPVLRMDHELLRGLEIEQAPKLYGYIVTYGKPAAEILLETPRGDPLLAVRRYGLGRTAAFTSDLSARWAKEWLSWPRFGQFAAQLVRWLQRKSAIEAFDTAVEVRDGQGIVRVDVYDDLERFINHLELEGKVLPPDQQTLFIAFKQIAPGRYQGYFPVPGQGGSDYLLTLVGKHGEATVGPKTVGIALPYSPEYLGLDVNYTLLQRLTRLTGGRMLRLNAPEEATELLFASSGQDLTALKEFWPWFVILALFIFVVEIAVRQFQKHPQFSEPSESRPKKQTLLTQPTYDELEKIVRSRMEEQRQRPVLDLETRS